MTNQELFEQAVAGNWIAETFTRPKVDGGVGKFYLQGTSKGYTTFGDTVRDGDVVFYAAFDDDCNREAGFGKYNADDQSITPVESNATLANGQYIDGDVQPIAFPNGGTITGTFNAVAFNAIWSHIWDKNNPHEVSAEQVDQDNENNLGDNVQDALDNLSGIIAEWDAAIRATCQNYVSELPPPSPQKGDMWTDVGVSGEQYVWEGQFWVSVTGGGLGIDLDDPESLPSNIVYDEVGDDLTLYDKPLNRVISSYDGSGKWVEATGGGLPEGESQNILSHNGEEWVATDAVQIHPSTSRSSLAINNGGITLNTSDGGDEGQFKYSQYNEVTISHPTYGAQLYMQGQSGDPSKLTVNEGYFVTVKATDYLDADGNSIIGGGGDQVWTVSEPDEYGQRLSKFADQVADSDANGLPFYIRYVTDGNSDDGQSSLMQASLVYGDTIWGNRLKATNKVEATAVEAESVTAESVTAAVLGSGLNVTAGLVVHGIGIKSDEPAPKLGAGYAIGAGYSDSPFNDDNFNFTVAFDGSVRSSKKIQALDFLDKDGNSIVHNPPNIPFDEDQGVLSVNSIRCSRDGATGNWGPDVYPEQGGGVLSGGVGENHAWSRLDTYTFKPSTSGNAYQQWAFDTDNESIAPPSNGPGVWALWECHSAPTTDFLVRIWGGKTAKDEAGVMKRPGIGAPQGRCEFYDGHFSEVRSGAYLDKDGGAMMSINDVIEGFSAVQQAVSDEVTVEGLRDAIANAVGGFIERLEARQAEVQGEVKKAADDYHELMESHYAKTQEERANA